MSLSKHKTSGTRLQGVVGHWWKVTLERSGRVTAGTTLNVSLRSSALGLETNEQSGRDVVIIQCYPQHNKYGPDFFVLFHYCNGKSISFLYLTYKNVFSTE